MSSITGRFMTEQRSQLLFIIFYGITSFNKTLSFMTRLFPLFQDGNAF